MKKSLAAITLCFLNTIVPCSPICAQEIPTKSTHTEPLVEWTSDDELPLLHADLILPKKDAVMFNVNSERVSFPKTRERPITSEAPFKTDDEAVAAAKKWLDDHFGALPNGVLLDVVNLEHSSSGSPTPQFDWDVGHTITFRAKYRGIPTDRHTVIYITGQSKFNASVDLRSYSAVGSGKKIVNSTVAKEAWRTIFASKDNAENLLKKLEERAKPKLRFIWSPSANLGRHIEGREILAPSWVLDDDGLVVVDGHSGKPWHND